MPERLKDVPDLFTGKVELVASQEIHNETRRNSIKQMKESDGLNVETRPTPKIPPEKSFVEQLEEKREKQKDHDGVSSGRAF